MDFKEVIYAVFTLGGLGLLFGLLLGFASKKFHVHVDSRILDINHVLPGLNCGGCGYPGCEAYASAIINEGVDHSLCSVGGIECVHAIGNILGIEIKNHKKEKFTAFIKCNGTCHNRKNKTNLEEFKTCIEANEKEGNTGCRYGCLGLGCCVNKCKFGAIEVVNGVALVNEEKCTNCGACIKVCPRNLIESVPKNKVIRVACNSNDAGKVVRENCSTGCIGCKICENKCPKGSITIDNNLASINYEGCVNCGICFEKCPTKAILKLE